MAHLNGEIWKVKLYPVRGREQDGIRPCLIVSPDSMNSSLQTIIVLPMTTSLKNWPTRASVFLDHTEGQVCIEHIRSVSKERFVQKIGAATEVEMTIVRKHILAVFAE